MVTDALDKPAAPSSSNLKMEAAGFSETVVTIHENTWCHIPGEWGSIPMVMRIWDLTL
jgi:hypothetical protein